jgi:hypothetical protein
VSLRVYAVATADGYQVMPGGLTRVAAKAGAVTLSMQSGGGSIAWVASGGGSLVTWVDYGTWDSLVGRWVGWFGALQERVRQVQGTSLEGLQQWFSNPEPAGK